jgi:hypothetical protein
VALVRIIGAVGLLAFVLAGCAVNSGVVPNGQDSFTVSRQAASGLSDFSVLKPDAINEANQYCTSQKKSLVVLNAKDARPSAGPGDFPRAEIQFTCWDATKINSIIAACEERRIKGEIKGYKAAVECSTPGVLAAWRERRYPYMDLVNVYEASRLVGAEKVDSSKISVAEYKLQLAELQSRITSEEQRRNLAVANSQSMQVEAQSMQVQAQAATTAATGALLQGLGAFQAANRPYQLPMPQRP